MENRGHHDRVFHYLPFCFAASWIVLLTCLLRRSLLTLNTDLGKLAQLRPGTQISFVAVTIEAAVAARRAEAQALAREIPREPLLRTEFPSEFLLGLNLVDGVTADGDRR